jgi:putative transposase
MHTVTIDTDHQGAARGVVSATDLTRRYGAGDTGVTPAVRSGACESSMRPRPWASKDDDFVKRRRHTPEQIIRKLREAEKLLGEGRTVAEAARALEISENTYHRWRNQYGGMKADDAKRLRELERENARLKRIVADQALNIDALREVAKGNW